MRLAQIESKYLYRNVCSPQKVPIMLQYSVLSAQVTVLSGRPKLVPCPEDEDFLAAFDKMMAENIQVFVHLCVCLCVLTSLAV